MDARSTFAVAEFTPTDVTTEIETAVGVGVARMTKTFTGDLVGRSQTLFTYAYSPSDGTGTYVALESFEGSILGRSGTVNIAHSATTSPAAPRLHELVVVVPGSGTGELAGTGTIVIDEDDTHHLDLWID